VGRLGSGVYVSASFHIFALINATTHLLKPIRPPTGYGKLRPMYQGPMFLVVGCGVSRNSFRAFWPPSGPNIIAGHVIYRLICLAIVHNPFSNRCVNCLV